VKERPILFSGPMVRAILDGRKTQTRRLVKPQPPSNADLCLCKAKACGGNRKWHLPCPYGQPGDRLWVRETIHVMQPRHDGDTGGVLYRADGHADWIGKWTPSILMPRWASRITLEIEEVRVERLNEISEEDAKAEGCDPDDDPNSSYYAEFRDIWQSINSPGSWAENPFVWVVTFRVLGKEAS